MKHTLFAKSAFSNPRALLGLAIFATGIVLAVVAFALYPTAAQAQGKQQNLPAGKLTAQEAKTMAEGLKPLLNDSTEGLASVQHANGTVSTDLQGRFQNVTVAKRDANGVVTQACINNTDAAAGFFGIDRRLLGLAPKAEPQQPADR